MPIIRKKRLSGLGGRKYTTSINFRPSLLDKLYAICNERKIAFSVLLDELGTKYVEKYEKRKKVEVLRQQEFQNKKEVISKISQEEQVKYVMVKENDPKLVFEAWTDEPFNIHDSSSSSN